ncbi:MAG: NAD-dependent epimerase/dehydratase family protein [Candidatus Aenigmarchaeota archaeon]|nr:NAD-dependent epimerase/dehydratase family protein [Candidatus Aenigmarchaeota archaeon]
MLRNRKILVTGGAGFIGSHLVDRLAGTNSVTVLDSLNSGKMEYLQGHLDSDNVQFHKVDLVKEEIGDFFHGVEHIFHFAAHPDVKMDINSFNKFDQNFASTKNVLEEARKHSVKNFYFTSSSTVYGEVKTIPTPESYGPLRPISLYGASKLACEAIISGYSHSFGMNCIVFRLANVVGNRCHGVIPDFVSKLMKNSNELEILGNGMQKKSYIYVGDCIDAILFLIERSVENDVFNIGTEDDVIVKRIAEIVSEEMGIAPRLSYTGGSRGWKGDVPVMKLNIEKIKKLGWKPKYGSEDAVRKTVKEIVAAS